MNTLSAEVAEYICHSYERPMPSFGDTVTYVYQCMLATGVAQARYGYNLYLCAAYLRESTRD